MEAIMHVSRVAVRFSPEFMTILDERRRSLPDLPNREETVRRLVEQALASQSINHKPRKAARKAR
jgi:hypothetical protein